MSGWSGIAGQVVRVFLTRHEDGGSQSSGCRWTHTIAAWSPCTGERVSRSGRITVLRLYGAENGRPSEHLKRARFGQRSDGSTATTTRPRRTMRSFCSPSTVCFHSEMSLDGHVVRIDGGLSALRTIPSATCASKSEVVPAQDGHVTVMTGHRHC